LHLNLPIPDMLKPTSAEPVDTTVIEAGFEWVGPQYPPKLGS